MRYGPWPTSPTKCRHADRLADQPATARKLARVPCDRTACGTRPRGRGETLEARRIRDPTWEHHEPQLHRFHEGPHAGTRTHPADRRGCPTSISCVRPGIQRQQRRRSMTGPYSPFLHQRQQRGGERNRAWLDGGRLQSDKNRRQVNQKDCGSAGGHLLHEHGFRQAALGRVVPAGPPTDSDTCRGESPRNRVGIAGFSSSSSDLLSMLILAFQGRGADWPGACWEPVSRTAQSQGSRCFIRFHGVRVRIPLRREPSALGLK